MADSSAPTIKAVGFRTVVLVRYFKKFFEREEGFYMGYHNIVILYIGYFLGIWGSIIPKVSFTLPLPIKFISFVVAGSIGFILSIPGEFLMDLLWEINDKCQTYIHEQFDGRSGNVIGFFLGIAELCLIILFLYIIFRVSVYIGIKMLNSFARILA